jgi:hypothetical protein
MNCLIVCTLLLTLVLFSSASEIDVNIASRVSVDTSANVTNRRIWYVVDGPGFIAGLGISVTRAPGFSDVDAMFAGLTLIQQCALGFAWFESATDYSLNNANGNSVTFQSAAAAFAFFSRFWGIVEYLDTNGIPGFQPGDAILSFYPLSRTNLTDWKPINVSSVTLSTGDVVYVVTIQTVDEVFALQVFIAPRPIIADNATIDQDSVKIAIEINYYNYSGASSDPNARIALAVLVGAAEAVSFTSGTVASVVIPSGNSIYRGYQDWDLGFTLANTDGSNARSGTVQSYWEVKFSNVSEIQGQYEAGWIVSAAYFSFGVNETRPGHIWWDPQMGATVNYYGNSHALQLAPAALTLVFIFFVVLINALNLF